ncbi:MAG: ABC transporter ATP-binding protein [Defluviitaleaceae bacterium]|nr:ABC transporter ATP-binding protein [Defluviitaleaceae bacterium]
MGNAIEITKLCKQYTGFMLNNVSFNVPRGLCCGFVGPNGAGKTTTLKAILGMIHKDSGEIRVLGNPEGDAATKEKIGVMFDQPYFQEDWTPLNIETGLKPFYRNWDSNEYQKYLSRFGLDPQKRFKDFSRGMKMKLAMAVNLSYSAELLLLDEPTGGLDPVARDEMLDIMREYMINDDRTILFSTHITSDLERIADMIVYVSNGIVSFCGDKDELVSAHCVVRGGKLPEEKRKFAIGLREYSGGYECLMKVNDIGGLPAEAVTERATIDDVVVYMERGAKNA